MLSVLVSTCMDPLPHLPLLTEIRVDLCGVVSWILPCGVYVGMVAVVLVVVEHEQHLEPDR